ncbi:MAG: glutamyl-tRNA reductase [Methanobrevibacter sp.]|jgi:glutamyl-tRNA reductase|nr:glutamyl-tRNA reductase [Methanobrevibacter sp.]
MIINIRVDYKIANIETMEKLTAELKTLFNQFRDEFHIQEYIEISTCNREEYYIHTDSCSYNHPLLDYANKDLIIEYGDSAILHLLRMTSGLESMIVGEDQILGQIKDAKGKSEKEGHCGKILNTLFTKAIHVGQAVRNKTNINRGSVSIGSAAVDLAEKHFDELVGKCVLVIGAGKMGALVAKALSVKNLKAILVAIRTYYRAVRLAEELNGEAILLDNINEHLSHADLIISATGSPHLILSKERIKDHINPNKQMIMIDLANPRDISEDVQELNIKLFNIDDLRGIANENAKKRQNEAEQAEEIITEEFKLLKKSFKTLEVEDILSQIRLSMEEVRRRESQKAIYKLDNNKPVEYNEKVIEGLSKSIVNKIFHDISKNIKISAENNDNETLKTVSKIFKNQKD